MGGGSSSSSSSSSTTTNQTDERIAAESSIVADDNAVVEIMIEDVSPEALGKLTEFGDRILTFAESSRDESFKVAAMALQRSFDNTDGAQVDLVRGLIKWGAVAGIAAVSARYAPDLVRALK